MGDEAGGSREGRALAKGTACEASPSLDVRPLHRVTAAWAAEPSGWHWWQTAQARKQGPNPGPQTGTGPWPVGNRAAQQVSGGQVSEASWVPAAAPQHRHRRLRPSRVRCSREPRFLVHKGGDRWPKFLTAAVTPQAMPCLHERLQISRCVCPTRTLSVCGPATANEGRDFLGLSLFFLNPHLLGSIISPSDHFLHSKSSVPFLFLLFPTSFSVHLETNRPQALTKHCS